MGESETTNSIGNSSSCWANGLECLSESSSNSLGGLDEFVSSISNSFNLSLTTFISELTLGSVIWVWSGLISNLVFMSTLHLAIEDSFLTPFTMFTAWWRDGGASGVSISPNEPFEVWTTVSSDVPDRKKRKDGQQELGRVVKIDIKAQDADTKNNK